MSQMFRKGIVCFLIAREKERFRKEIISLRIKNLLLVEKTKEKLRNIHVFLPNEITDEWNVIV